MAPAVTESVTTSRFRCVTNLTGGFQSKVEKAVSVRGLFLKGHGKNKRTEKKSMFHIPKCFKKKRRKKARARESSCTLFRALHQTHEF